MVSPFPISDTPDFSRASLKEAPADAGYEKSCGAVIVHDDKILLVHQSNGLNSFPKGHVETFDQSEIDTALREVKEEVGLDVIIDPSTRQVFSYYIPRLNVKKDVVLFVARLKDPSATPSRQETEIDTAEWIPIDQVASCLNYPAWRSVWQTIRTKYL